jgi:hypothetical protein
LLFVSVVLPNGPIDALLTTVTHDQVRGERGKLRWLIGSTITKMTEADTTRLSNYLKKLAEQEPIFESE